MIQHAVHTGYWGLGGFGSRPTPHASRLPYTYTPRARAARGGPPGAQRTAHY
jgi:hypothetical protein